MAAVVDEPLLQARIALRKKDEWSASASESRPRRLKGGPRIDRLRKTVEDKPDFALQVRVIRTLQRETALSTYVVISPSMSPLVSVVTVAL